MCGFFPRTLAIIPAIRYTRVFLPHILAFFPGLWGFYSQVYIMTIFLQPSIYMRKKKPIYIRYKQACGIWGHRKSSYKRHRMAALILSKVWFSFIALTVLVVVGSPTTDLLESVDCLLRDCVRYFTNADRNNDLFI